MKVHRFKTELFGYNYLRDELLNDNSDNHDMETEVVEPESIILISSSGKIYASYYGLNEETVSEIDLATQDKTAFIFQ